MEPFVLLRATDLLEDRPFTDPAQSAGDLELMCGILAIVRTVLTQPLDWPAEPMPLVLRRVAADDRNVRLVFRHRADLLAGADLFAVGFFGQRRLEKDRTLINAVDEDLVHEFSHHPGILSYSSFELSDGNYANLVLLRTEADKEHWRTSVKHSYAARELSPEFYTCVRLHNALLPGGLAGNNNPVLIRTKYFDYSRPESWRAMREIAPGSDALAGTTTA